jgi:hypothetical protein
MLRPTIFALALSALVAAPSLAQPGPQRDDRPRPEARQPLGDRDAAAREHRRDHRPAMRDDRGPEFRQGIRERARERAFRDGFDGPREQRFKEFRPREFHRDGDRGLRGRHGPEGRPGQPGLEGHRGHHGLRGRGGMPGLRGHHRDFDGPRRFGDLRQHRFGERGFGAGRPDLRRFDALREHRFGDVRDHRFGERRFREGRPDQPRREFAPRGPRGQAPGPMLRREGRPPMPMPRGGQGPRFRDDARGRAPEMFQRERPAPREFREDDERPAPRARTRRGPRID